MVTQGRPKHRYPSADEQSAVDEVVLGQRRRRRQSGKLRVRNNRTAEGAPPPNACTAATPPPMPCSSACAKNHNSSSDADADQRVERGDRCGFAASRHIPHGRRHHQPPTAPRLRTPPNRRATLNHMSERSHDAPTHARDRRGVGYLAVSWEPSRRARHAGRCRASDDIG